MQCKSEKNNAVQCSAVQSSIMQCSEEKSITVQCRVVWYRAVQGVNFSAVKGLECSVARAVVGPGQVINQLDRWRNLY